MSRKYLIDNGLFQGSTSEQPTVHATAGRKTGGWKPGSLFLNEDTGKAKVNMGTLDDAIYADIMGQGLADRFCLVEHFRQCPGINADLASGTEATREPVNNNFETLGGNATSALVTFADGGGITLTTAGGANATDSIIIAPHLDTKQTAWAAAKWNTLDRVIWETTIKTGASLDCIIWAGLKLTNVNTVATDDNQVYFRYAAAVNSGTWGLVSSRAGTDTTTNSALTVAVSTKYHLMISIDGARVPHFFINGVEYGVGQSALTTNIDLIPYIGVIQATNSVAGVVTCRGIALSKEYND